MLLGNARFGQSHFYVFVEGSDIDNNAKTTCEQ